MVQNRVDFIQAVFQRMDCRPRSFLIMARSSSISRSMALWAEISFVMGSLFSQTILFAKWQCASTMGLIRVPALSLVFTWLNAYSHKRACLYGDKLAV